MKYIISDTSVVPITETSGTIQVVTQGATIEISDTQNFTDSLILSSINTRTFEKKLYIRAYGEFAQPIEVNVANFNIGTGGGGISSSERVDIETSLKAVNVVGNTVCFYTSTDTSITPAYSYDYPEEIFLDQAGTTLVKNFVFSGLLYPNTLDPNLNGKTVLVLAVKGDATTPTVKYSFVDVSTLIDVYTPADNSIDITNKAIKVNLSTDTSNALTTTPNGLLSKLYSSIGDNTDGAMTQAAIKSYVEQELDKTDWQLDGNIYRYGKVYKNVSPLLEIGGVDVSKIQFATDTKRVSIPSDAYDSDTQVSLVSNGYYASIQSSTVNGGISFKSTGDKNTINSGDGNDTIYNTGSSAKVTLGDGNDTIYNTGDSVRVILGDGNDTLYNTGDSVFTHSAGGDDSITNTGDYVTIYAATGNNEINNTGEYVSIVASSDTTINNTAQKYSVSIVGGGAFNNRDNVRINASSDDVSVTNTGDFVTINADSGNDTIYNTGDSVLVSLGYNDSITNTGDYVTIHARYHVGNDTISNSGDNVSIYGYAGNDYIENSGDNVTINGYASNDYIYNTGDNAVVSLGYGNDTVSLGGENTHVTLRFAGNYSESLNSIFGFDQVNHVIQIINSDTSITDTTIDGGEDTRLILTNNAKPSIQTTVDLYGVSEGSVNVQFGDNEVTVYNLGGD